VSYRATCVDNNFADQCRRAFEIREEKDGRKRDEFALFVKYRFALDYRFIYAF